MSADIIRVRLLGTLFHSSSVKLSQLGDRGQNHDDMVLSFCLRYSDYMLQALVTAGEVYAGRLENGFNMYY